VSELAVSSNYEVVAFALNQEMYCDIAVRPRLPVRGHVQ